jgi:putative IMPACT (imprinted ancient) family translation regulator
MQADNFIGIDDLYSSEYRASGSKFYGFLFPIKNPQDFDEKIKEYKSKYADSTHVCSACVIGLEREYQKCSDDGEPSNSSGRPILHALLSSEMTYVGIAVVRYYGGKKLGIPGLIEAYGGAAQICLDSSIRMELTVMSDIFCTISAAKSYLLYNFLARRKELSHKTNTDGQFIITCSKSMTTELQKELIKIDTLALINE